MANQYVWQTDDDITDVRMNQGRGSTGEITGEVTSASNIVTTKLGVGIQKARTDATSGNVFRKCSATAGDTGESGNPTVVDVVTLAAPSGATAVIAGGTVYIVRTSDGQSPVNGCYAWNAQWTKSSGQSGAHTCSITAIKSVATPPTIAFSTDTIQITIPGYYVGFITCDLADNNTGLTGITWGTAFGG